MNSQLYVFIHFIKDFSFKFIIIILPVYLNDVRKVEIFRIID